MNTNYVGILQDAEAIGTEAFAFAWRDAGRALAGDLPEELKKDSARICVLSTAQDYDLVAKGFSEALRSQQVMVTRYCLWNKFRPRQDVIPSSNALLGQHSDEHPAEVNAVIGVSSTTVEDATLADNMSRVAAKYPNAKRYLACLASSSELEGSLAEHFADRDMTPPLMVRLPRHVSANEITISAGDLRDRLLTHLQKVFGRSGLGYVPERAVQHPNIRRQVVFLG